MSTLDRDLGAWTPRPRPVRRVLAGRYARLEPLAADQHLEGLFAAATAPDAAGRFRWLFQEPPASRAALRSWMQASQASDDPLYFAVLDPSGVARGWQSLMRIEPAHGVIEIGNIFWGPSMARTPMATEAQYLFARYVFDELGYRRYEWKCHADNAPSKRAALRFGFQPEGVFRQHMVFKGGNRDTAWFSILDSEWPTLQYAYEMWLDPVNFDGDGRQKSRLEECRDAAARKLAAG